MKQSVARSKWFLTSAIFWSCAINLHNLVIYLCSYSIMAFSCNTFSYSHLHSKTWERLLSGFSIRQWRTKLHWKVKDPAGHHWDWETERETCIHTTLIIIIVSLYVELLDDKQWVWKWPCGSGAKVLGKTRLDRRVSCFFFSCLSFHLSFTLLFLDAISHWIPGTKRDTIQFLKKKKGIWRIWEPFFQIQKKLIKWHFIPHMNL